MSMANYAKMTVLTLIISASSLTTLANTPQNNSDEQDTKKALQNKTDIEDDNNVRYSITFDKRTRKKPEIKNKKVKLQLYKNHSPYKKFETKTNEEGEISFDKKLSKNLAIALNYIEDQEKLKLKCTGYALPGKKNINVHCE